MTIKDHKNKTIKYQLTLIDLLTIVYYLKPRKVISLNEICDFFFSNVQ